MHIGLLQFELLIHGAESLKDKRRVVRSLKDRLHREHMVSLAEVAALDVPTRAVMGLACVGVDGQRIGEVLDHVMNKLRALTDAELGGTRRAVVNASLVLDEHESEVETPEEAARNEAQLAREMIAYFNGAGGASDPSIGGAANGSAANGGAEAGGAADAPRGVSERGRGEPTGGGA